MLTPGIAPRISNVLLGLFLVSMFAPATASAQTDAESLRTYIERTGEILRRSADFVSDAPNPRAVRMLEQARLAHARSIELAQAGQPKSAFLYSQRAREGAQKAARIARESAGNAERLQRRLERYMELRERVTERVRESGDERALRFLRESEQQARRARDLQQQGDPQLALQVLKSAEDLLARAARIAFEGAGEGRLERELQRTRDFIERVSGTISDDTAAAELLTSARMALGRAEEAARQGRAMRALKSLQLARRLAGRAAAASQDERIDESGVQLQIERFDERFDRVRERVAESGSAPAQQALERARVHRERAANLLGEGKLEPALRQIKAGFDLLAAANELAG
jgi:hypothetical protein